MGHMVELVVMWAAWSLVVGVLAGLAALVVRVLTKQEWSGIRIAEGAFAVGVVMGFVLMLFWELLG